MAQHEGPSYLRKFRTALMGIVVVFIVGGLALIISLTGQTGGPAAIRQVDALSGSTDDCVTCHRQATPGIVEQFSHSAMAVAEVRCRDCHEVPADYPAAMEHEGTYVLGNPTPASCQKCHAVEVAEFNQSRHALPAYAAYAGTANLDEQLMTLYASISEGGFAAGKAPNALYVAEGPEITQFACEQCHDVGKPQPDGSVGQCEKCHLRHTFSLEQARKPETCNACHIGPDHPQWEIYTESPHGIAYATGGDNWNWTAEAGTLTTSDFPAPTCAVCHMSGFGATGTTHDVGDRLTWYLAAATSERRPAWQENQVRMQNVCRACHNANFIQAFYASADQAVQKVNDWVKESDRLIVPLVSQGLLTPDPYDEPVDFTHFELWHHWGRTAKFGAWMQGPDYSQWHGAYEILKSMSELREMVQTKLDAGGR